MGSKSEVFCRQTIRLLEQNPQIIPPSMDLDGAVADLAALDRLRPIHEQLRQLLSRMDDTITALGSDAMDFSLQGYGQIKLSGAAPGVAERRREISERVYRKGAV